jgi:hypothetical protein
MDRYRPGCVNRCAVCGLAIQLRQVSAHIAHQYPGGQRWAHCRPADHPARPMRGVLE